MDPQTREMMAQELERYSQNYVPKHYAGLEQLLPTSADYDFESEWPGDQNSEHDQWDAFLKESQIDKGIFRGAQGIQPSSYPELEMLVAAVNMKRKKNDEPLLDVEMILDAAPDTFAEGIWDNNSPVQPRTAEEIKQLMQAGGVGEMYNYLLSAYPVGPNRVINPEEYPEYGVGQAALERDFYWNKSRPVGHQGKSMYDSEGNWTPEYRARKSELDKIYK